MATKPRKMIGLRIRPELVKVFEQWGGRDRLETTLTHWKATNDGKKKAGLPAAKVAA